MINLVILDLNNSASCNLFIHPTKVDLNIPVPLSFKQGKLEFRVYCLRTFGTETGQYDHVINSGKTVGKYPVC